MPQCAAGQVEQVTEGIKKKRAVFLTERHTLMAITRQICILIAIICTVTGCAYNSQVTLLSSRSVAGAGRVETDGGAAVQVPLPTQ